MSVAEGGLISIFLDDFETGASYQTFIWLLIIWLALLGQADMSILIAEAA